MSIYDQQQAPDWSSLSVHQFPGDSPGFRFWRDFLSWQRQLNAHLREVDLTQPQFAILAVCAWLTRDRRTVSQQDIASLTGMDRMLISQIVSKLEKKGLLHRRPSDQDGRANSVTISKQGHDRLAKAVPLVETFDLAFFQEKRISSSLPARDF